MTAFIPKRHSRGEGIVSVLACTGCYACLLLLLLFSIFGPWLAAHIRWVP